MIVAEQCDKTDVSLYEPVRNNNAPTFATLYQVDKHTKDRYQKTAMKADRNIILNHELLPVPVSLAEMNGTLRTGNKSELAYVVT